MIEVVLMCQLVLTPAKPQEIELHCPGIPEKTKVVNVYSEPIGNIVKLPVDKHGTTRVIITPKANNTELTDDTELH